MYATSDHRRILIVDDDPSVRELLRIVLEAEDFEVVGEAKDGVEAITRAVELQPDFVVLDQQMPNRDGAATAAMLRLALPEAAIIACSAIAEKKPAWADAFLAKQNMGDVGPLVQGLIDLRN